jgi:hypothetical protein
MGTTYYIVVARWATTTSGPNDFWDFKFDLIPTPTHDDCATAKVIDQFPIHEIIPLSTVTDDDIAIASGFGCTSGAGPQRRGVWYTFTARDGFILMAEDIGAHPGGTGPMVFALFEGTCGALTQVPGCSRNGNTSFGNGPGSGPEDMVIQAGHTYFLYMGEASTTALPGAEQQFYDHVIYTLGSDVGRCATGSPTCSLTIRQNCAGTFLPGAGPCPADFDCMNGLEVADIFNFLARWFAGDPRADWDGDHVHTISDIFAYLASWFAGCPS